MKRLLMASAALCLLVLFSFALAEEDERKAHGSGDFDYALLEDGTAEIVNYRGYATELAIPDALDGYAVSSLGDSAFAGRSSLVSVSIPDSIVSIGANPFRDCESLAEILVSPDQPLLAVIDNVLFRKADKTLVCLPAGLRAERYAVPEGILSIGSYAFDGCSVLSHIEIPNSTASLGVNPFENCGSLAELVLAPDHPDLLLVDRVLFSRESRRLVCCLAGFDAERYTVPAGIRSIDERAFDGCVNLENIVLPDSLVSIGDYAFNRCERLRDVVLPEHLASLGSGAFGACASLASIVLPDSIDVVPGFAFSRCEALAEVRLPAGLTAVENGAFNGCSALTALVLPEGAVSIGRAAFLNCKSLAVVTIPESVAFIGEGAFYGCPDLTLTVPHESYAVQYCRDNGLSYIYPDALSWLND